MAADALLLISFGGPEGPDDVIPFLENVTRGRHVPAARLEAVAARYFEMGGRSPINDQNRALVAALSERQDRPVYWGNRNWHPYLADTLAQMREDRVGQAVAFTTSAYSSYSGCAQYLEDIARGRAKAGPGAPEVVKIGPYFDHPGFVTPLAEGLRAGREAAGAAAPVLMTAHSIPVAMAGATDYQAQLREAAAMVADGAGAPGPAWQLVFQSRSGPPQEPWLEPAIEDAIDALPPGTADLVVVPVGFVSDHMEVVYDLDRQAAAHAAARGIRMTRTPTPGSHPSFVDMIVELAGDPRPCRAGCCSPAAR